MIGRAYTWNSHAVTMISCNLLGMWIDGSSSSHVSLCSSVVQYKWSTSLTLMLSPLLNKGRWAGFAPSVSDTLTFQILMDDTQHVI